MHVQINGTPQELPPGISIQNTLTLLGYESQAIAIAIDGQFIPKHRYPHETLQEHQHIEVLSPMQGG